MALGEAMRRRQFITLVGSAAFAPMLSAALAQQPTKPVIGFLRLTSAKDSAQLLAAWHEGLKDAGYIEGQNVSVEYRWAENHLDRLPSLAAELVRRQVTVILAGGNDAAHAAKAATRGVPIVFAIGEDPVKTGLVASFNRPGANLTGATFITSATATKKLQLLNELLPKGTTIAYLRNPKNAQTELELKEAQNAARSLGHQILVLEAGTDSEIDAAFATLVERRAGGLMVAADAFFFSRRTQLIVLAARHAVPTVYQWSEAVTGGGLMSYGPSFPGTYRQAGLYAGRILQGANPAELPVLQPTKFEFAINLRTAKTLGLAIPSGVLAIADEAIE